MSVLKPFCLATEQLSTLSLSGTVPGTSLRSDSSINALHDADGQMAIVRHHVDGFLMNLPSTDAATPIYKNISLLSMKNALKALKFPLLNVDSF